MKLIVLNSVLFSTHAKGRGVDLAAENELRWLHLQLQALKEKHQKALIAMHIPIGIDLYALWRYLRLLDLWKTNYLQRFEAELKQNSSQIDGILVGHLHSNWFQILMLDNSSHIPLTGTTSISPIFGNNPGFKIYSFTPQSQQLKDEAIYTYSMDVNKSWVK